MKNISTIQKFSKFGKVIATIEVIFYVLACVILVGCVILGAVASDQILSAIQQELAEFYGYSLTRNDYYGVLLMIFIALLELLANTFVAFSANSYFKKELKAGTPYTREGVAQLKRLGKYKIFIPIIASLISTVLGIILGFYTVDGTISVTFVVKIAEPVFIGMLYIVVSLVCEDTVDLLEASNQKTTM